MQFQELTKTHNAINLLITYCNYMYIYIYIHKNIMMYNAKTVKFPFNAAYF